MPRLAHECLSEKGLYEILSVFVAPARHMRTYFFKERIKHDVLRMGEAAHHRLLSFEQLSNELVM